MALSKSQRRQVAESFAHLIGGYDSEGREHKLARTAAQVEIKKSQHLFAVLDVDKDNMMWDFVNGRHVIDYINAGRFKVEYMGHNRDTLGNKKVRKIMLEQIKQHVDAVRAKHERQGRFEEDAFYENLLNEKTAEAKKKFEAYDKSKETA